MAAFQIDGFMVMPAMVVSHQNLPTMAQTVRLTNEQPTANMNSIPAGIGSNGRKHPKKHSTEGVSLLYRERSNTIRPNDSCGRHRTNRWTRAAGACFAS